MAAIVGEYAVRCVEKAMGTDVGRNMASSAELMLGCLERAARSLLRHPRPRVVILTGFFVPAAEPPSAETDGPLGAAQIAAAISILGGTARILTDETCVAAVRTAAGCLGPSPAVDVAPQGVHVRPADWPAWRSRILRKYTAPASAISHVISVERVGPAGDGRFYNMHGVDISHHTAPLHEVFYGGPWSRIAIGDGGNEIGMGLLPRSSVAGRVSFGHRIHCVAGCDHLLIGGTSNWAAAGLVAALHILSGGRHPELAELLRPEWSLRILNRFVADGTAVDGVFRRPAVGVDGLSWEDYRPVLDAIYSIARSPGEAGLRSVPAAHRIG